MAMGVDDAHREGTSEDNVDRSLVVQALEAAVGSGEPFDLLFCGLPAMTDTAGRSAPVWPSALRCRSCPTCKMSASRTQDSRRSRLH